MTDKLLIEHENNEIRAEYWIEIEMGNLLVSHVLEINCELDYIEKATMNSGDTRYTSPS